MLQVNKMLLHVLSKKYPTLKWNSFLNLLHRVSPMHIMDFLHRVKSIVTYNGWDLLEYHTLPKTFYSTKNENGFIDEFLDCFSLAGNKTLIHHKIIVYIFEKISYATDKDISAKINILLNLNIDWTDSVLDEEYDKLINILNYDRLCTDTRFEKSVNMLQELATKAYEQRNAIILSELYRVMNNNPDINVCKNVSMLLHSFPFS